MGLIFYALDTLAKYDIIVLVRLVHLKGGDGTPN
jgi:hypothetical protein